MRKLFQHRWTASVGITLLGGVLTLLLGGQLDLLLLLLLFLLSAIVFSYPSFVERAWQSRHLPADSLHVPASLVKNGEEVQILTLFDLPQIYTLIKNRYKLKQSDSSACGLFLYFYLPMDVYENRNLGADAIYLHIAQKLKDENVDAVDIDLIAQRNLPLSFGFRFVPKNGFRFYEYSRMINIVKKDYYRDNTRIRGVLQSKRRLFRLHAPEDSEWRTFIPYHDEAQSLAGGASLAHDFRSDAPRLLSLQNLPAVEAERVEYPEKVPFGSLLTYAKKGEITLEDHPEATDRLYIDRVNVLMRGSEQRSEVLRHLSSLLGREIGEEDFYPLFNYGQKLRGYMETGKSVSDYLSSRGNFALYYDQEKGWTVLRLGPDLELRVEEAYWSTEPKMVKDRFALTTSRVTLICGSADSLLRFQISTGTPTRGQIFVADEMIEAKMKTFAQIYRFKLLKQIGSGAEGCIYLAEKEGKRFYLKSPDGQLAEEEMHTIENLKKTGLIPDTIKTYREDRMILLPEFKPLPPNDNPLRPVAMSLIFQYLRNVWNAGYVCLDLTPDHVRIDSESEKLFFIDFSGYTTLSTFQKHAKELLADRKKIEYRTPEESVQDFRDGEKFQIYLIGLLFYELASGRLPLALKFLGNGSGDYSKQLIEDVRTLSSTLPLEKMLEYDPSERESFVELQPYFNAQPEEVKAFWRSIFS